MCVRTTKMAELPLAGVGGGRWENCERRGERSPSALLLAGCFASVAAGGQLRPGDLLASPIGPALCSSLPKSKIGGSRHPDDDAHLTSQARISLPSRAIVLFTTSMHR